MTKTIYKAFTHPVHRTTYIFGLLWAVLLVCSFWSFDNSFYPVIILLATIVFYFTFISRKALTIRYLDVCLILIFIIELLNYFSSSYRPNTFWFLTRFSIALSFYLTYAIIGNYNLTYRVKIYLAMYGVIIGIISFFSFESFRSSVLDEGFSDVANLRHLYAPMGHLVNDWSLMLLFFLSFVVFYYLKGILSNSKNRTWFGLGVIFLLFGLLATFSRGIYLSTFLFFSLLGLLLATTKLLSRKTILQFFAFLTITVLGLIMLIGNPVLQTLKLTGTTSQRRSIDGRLSIWHTAKNIFSDFPLSGIGGNNFSLYYANHRENPELAFTTRINSSFIQLLVEKGILGTCAYSLLFICILWVLIKQIKTSESTTEHRVFIAVVLSLMLAFLIKELTFSSFFENGPLMTLFFLVCALIRRYSREALVLKPTNLGVRLVAGGSLLLLSLFAYKYYLAKKASEYGTLAVSFVRQNDFDKALVSLDKAIDLNPQQAIYYIHRATIREKKFANEVISNSLWNENVNYGRYHRPNASHSEIASISDYEEALKLNPYDDRAHQNLGWIYFTAGKMDKAINHMEMAVKLDPTEEMGMVSLALVFDSLKRTDSADHYYIRAINQSPAFLQSVFWRHFSAKDSLRASMILSESSKYLKSRSEKDIISKAKYAAVLMRENKDVAVDLLKQVNDGLPNLSMAWLNLGILQMNPDSVTEGINCVKRSILLDNSNYLGILIIADYFEKSRVYNEAISFFKRALKMQINAGSMYDRRVGKTYEVPSSMQTFYPADLWQDVNFQLSLSDICKRIGKLYQMIGNTPESEYYYELSKRRSLSDSDFDI